MTRTHQLGFSGVLVKKKKKKSSEMSGTSVFAEEGDGAELYSMNSLPTAGRKNCATSRTWLMVPFSFFEPHEEVDVSEIMRFLLSRSLGPETYVWEQFCLSPSVTSEFTPHFRKLIGEGERRPNVWLRVRDEVRRALFADATLWAEGDTVRKCFWADVELAIYPYGAVLCVLVDWEGISCLHDIRAWVYLSKFCKAKVGVTRGWSFSVPEDLILDLRNGFSSELIDSFNGKPRSLVHVFNWLVMMPNELSAPRARIFDASYNFHFTCLLLTERPSESDEVALSNIAYQEGGRNRTKGASGTSESKVLRLRENRLVEICRRGVVGVEWGSQQTSFTLLFMGQFRALTVHILAERQVLVQLSVLSSDTANELPSLQSPQTLQQKNATRKRMIGLASSMMRYMLGMSSEQCGGRSSLQLFYTCLREVFKIDALKKELRKEVKDTLRIVESDYLEERRAMQRRNRLLREHKDFIDREKERRASKQRDILQVVLSLAGAVLLPFTIVSGIFGMNNSDTPVQISWGWLIGGTGIFSVATFALLWLLYACAKPDFSDLEKPPEEAGINPEEIESYINELERF